MSKIFTLLFFVVNLSAIQAQNLIKNGSFDDYSSCPDLGRIDKLNFWSSPNAASPDFFHRCAGPVNGVCQFCIPQNNVGYQDTQQGDGYVGCFTELFPNSFNAIYREYIRAPLEEELKANQSYSFKFYINLATLSVGGTIAPQIHFSNDDYNTSATHFISIIPTIVFDTVVIDTANWIELKQCFIAEGGEKFITIGNFRDTIGTRYTQIRASTSRRSYYLIDNLSLEEVGTDLVQDSAILCKGDSLIVQLPNTNNYIWSDGITTNPRVIKKGGKYFVSPNTACPFTDSIEVKFIERPTLDLPDSIFICENGSVTLEPKIPNSSWLWSDGSTDSSFVITEPGVVWCQVTNVCGTTSDTIYVERVLDPKSDLPSDTIICEGDTLWLVADPNLNPIWEGNIRSDSFMVTEQGSFLLELSNHCGIVQDIIQVKFEAKAIIEIDCFSPRSAHAICPICEGDSVLYSVSVTVAEGRSWYWNDGSQDSSKWVKYDDTVWVQAWQCGGLIRTVFSPIVIDPPSINLPNDTTLCSDAIWTIEVSSPGILTEIMWNDGSTGRSRNITTAGLYWIEMTNPCGYIRDSVMVYFTDPPEANIGPDTALCLGDTLTIEYQGLDDWVWSDGSTDRLFYITSSGTYYLDVENSCGVRRDSLTITSENPPILILPDSVEICFGETEPLMPFSNQQTWTWQDGSTSPSFNVNENGLVWATTNNTCGWASDTTIVNVIPFPSFDFVSEDTTICFGDSIKLSAESSNASIEWQLDLSEEENIVVTQSGNYDVIASNFCGIVQEQIHIETIHCGCNVYIPNTFSPNGDNINDRFEIFAACKLENVEISIFSRWGERVYQNQDDNILWDGNFNQEPLLPGVYVYTLRYNIGELSFVKSGSISLTR